MINFIASSTCPEGSQQATKSLDLNGPSLLSTMKSDVELTEKDRDRIQEITEDFENDMEKVMA